MTLTAIRSLVLAALMLWPCGAIAQNTNQPPAQQLLKPPQLDALLAPIALYPDTLLSEVLMASTYPLEVVEAERWVNANKNLKGDQLKAAVDKQDWDDSVKSLIATPSVLEMMSTKLDWTQKLGDAVIDQQADVMDAIQRLRAKAQANNKLQSTKQQTVTVRQQQGRQVIAIEPADPDTVYVPYYDPGVVYGAWPYSDYPPYYWPAPGYIAAGVIATGIAFGAGYALARWGGNYWRGNVNWNNNNLTVNRPGGGNIGANWNRGAHVEHRLGNRGGRQQGLNFRGSGGQQVLRPGGGGGRANRPANLGERPRAGQHPNFGKRGGGRQQVAARPSRGGSGARHHAAARNRGGGARAANVNRGGGARGANLNRGGGRPGGGVHRAAGIRAGGGGMRAHAGGGGMRAHAGGFRGGGGRGGGRRSDIRLKHDIVYLGQLDDGLGFYRFSYNGSSKAYVGVMAQEVQQFVPQAVVAGRDGYLRVDYDKLGLKFESYEQWIRSGAQLPAMRGSTADCRHAKCRSF
ncbi:MAG TPA: DUF3300 domain-containing protein [Xanthobacteraceae bacterium]|nr:DUF3300 domain-containing protein [Xanthobacteraceae bacterium]